MVAESRSGDASGDRDPGRGGRLSTAGVLEHAAEFVVALALIAMLAIIALDITTRSLFGFSFQVSNELSGYLLVAITFLSLSISHANQRFHNVEFVQARLSPRGRLASRLLFDVVAFIVCATLDWQFIRFEILSYQSGSMAPTTLMTPLWIPQILMPIGATLACIAILRTIVLRGRLLFASNSKDMR